MILLLCVQLALVLVLLGLGVVVVGSLKFVVLALVVLLHVVHQLLVTLVLFPLA